MERLAVECQTRLNISDLWDFADPQASEKIFLKKMKEHSKSAFEVWELQTQIARALGLQKKYIEAFHVLDSIQAGLEHAPVCESKDLVGIRYNLERGRILLLIEKVEDSIRCFRFAYKLATKIDADDLSIDAIKMLLNLTSISERIDLGLRGISIATKRGNENLYLSIGELATGVGQAYLENKEYQNAIEQFMHARDIYSKLVDAEHTRITRRSMCVAQRGLGNYKEALLELRMQEEWLKKSDNIDGIVFEEIAENLLALGYSSSSIYFSKALECFKTQDLIGDLDPKRISRMRELSRKNLN